MLHAYGMANVGASKVTHVLNTHHQQDLAHSRVRPGNNGIRETFSVHSVHFTFARAGPSLTLPTVLLAATEQPMDQPSFQPHVPR
jgi:hypothetical protein